MGYENIRFRAGTEDFKAAESGSVWKTAIVNALSPHPYLFWFVIGAPIIMNAYAMDGMAAVIFVASFYVCLSGAKIILAIAVNRSRGFLQGQIYVGVIRVLGAVLILFALRLFWDGLQLIEG
ncbi:MAG: Lysine exporter protein [Firmicutes bacterium]|nr:Lysine exporter protein [Bacillota bacterium]